MEAQRVGLALAATFVAVVVVAMLFTGTASSWPVSKQRLVFAIE
jgi:hypothetical protein